MAAVASTSPSTAIASIAALARTVLTMPVDRSARWRCLPSNRRHGITAPMRAQLRGSGFGMMSLSKAACSVTGFLIIGSLTYAVSVPWPTVVAKITSCPKSRFKPVDVTTNA